ncbi:unnamed protein product [Rotaria sordida]|uniref:Uncharacterized protein n=1 Tax=Rotaria sordida TaxID=392033 RepID=A0A815DCP1_9BILA|nr:unnamed protein product [Rotaria sordida]CAF1569588.1 unnamed protein product [Rotaria sordida]
MLLSNDATTHYYSFCENDVFEEDCNWFSTEITKSIKDQYVNEEEKKRKRKPYRKIFGKCPLTFNGAYGLTQANHSIKFCCYEKNYQTQLYNHFIKKHKLKEVCAQRLIQAIISNQDPMITKLFNENENVIDQFYNVLCPFSNGQINLPENSQHRGTHIPCRRRIIPLNVLECHLQYHHNISNLLAQKLVNSFKEI